VKFTKLFINGEFVDGHKKLTHSVINPCTGEEITKIALATAEDVDIAVKAA